VQCIGLINKYFKDTVNSDAFFTDNGAARLPLQLHHKFAWKAKTPKFLNYNVRRDIYAAWSVIRDRCVGKTRLLTQYGQQYRDSHPGWDVLSADEFAALYVPATTKPRLPLGTFVIRGASVTEFTA
jgi:hypothetical protein